MERVLPVHSLAAASLERVLDAAATWTVAASAWLESAWSASLAGRVAAGTAAWARQVIAGSRLVGLARLGFRLVFSPSAPPGWETWLGMSVGAAALLPTEVPLLLVLLLFPFWLRGWARDRHGARQAGATTGGGCQRVGATTGSGRQRTGTGVFVALFALALMLAGSVPGSVAPRHSLVEFVFWAAYGLVFLLGMDAARRGRGEQVLRPILALAALAGAVGIWQYLIGWTPPQSWVDPRYAEEITRVVGTFSNPTFFAEMMGLALPVTLTLFLSPRPWGDRCLLGVLGLLQAGGMILSFSRGGWLGLVVSLVVVAVLYDRRLLLVGIALALAAPFFLPEVLVERFLSSFTLDDSSNSYRVFIWRGSVALARAYLWTGTGLGADTFAYTYPEYMIIQTPAPHAHSTYLEMLVELGLPGLAALLWFLLAWVREVWAGLRGDERGGLSGARGRAAGLGFSVARAVMGGILAAVTGHLLHGVVEFTWYSPRVTLTFWTLLGVGLGAARLLTHRCTGRPAEVQ